MIEKYLKNRYRSLVASFRLRCALPFSFIFLFVFFFFFFENRFEYSLDFWFLWKTLLLPPSPTFFLLLFLVYSFPFVSFFICSLNPLGAIFIT